METTSFRTYESIPKPDSMAFGPAKKQFAGMVTQKTALPTTIADNKRQTG